MDMNKAFFLTKEQAKPQWRILNADGKILGRLATEISNMLRGKDRAVYTPHTMSEDYIVIINADKIKLSGNKMDTKIYDRYTGWIGGYKTETAGQMLAKHPERLIELAVKRMLPKNRSNKYFMRRLKVYTGTEHPHIAQVK
jgi:large subunit ribosomal protein L13